MKKRLKIISALVVIALIFNIVVPITKTFAISKTITLSVNYRKNDSTDNSTLGKVQYSLNNGATWNDVLTDTENLEVEVIGENLRLKIVPNANYSVDYAGIGLSLDNGQDITNLSDYGFESEEGYLVPSNCSSVQLNQVEFRNWVAPPPMNNGNNGVDNDNNHNNNNGNNHENNNGNNNINNNNWNNNNSQVNFDSTAYINLTIIGDEIENPYGDDASEIRVGVNNRNGGFMGISKNNVTNSYTTINGENKISRVTTNNPIEIPYQDTNETKVVIGIKAQWNTYLTNVEINGVSYANQLPKTKDELIEKYREQQLEIYFEANKAENNVYNIEVTGRKQNENEIIMGNFLWNYDANSTEAADDDKIPNARLEFVRAKYKNFVYNSVDEINALGGVYNWNNAVRKASYLPEDNPWGSATFPVGTELTVKLVPDEGYQLTSFGLNGNPFIPGDEPCVYTFTITGGNFHLEAKFTKEGNSVVNEAENVKGAQITLAESTFNYGTAKLSIRNTEDLSDNRISGFENIVSESGYSIDSYMDLSLYNTVYKGGMKDDNGNYQSWDTSIEKINNKATILIEPEENLKGKDIAIVHEVHNGNEILGYELINADYNAEDNIITFETDSFSNYAVAVKRSNEKDENNYGEEQNESNGENGNNYGENQNENNVENGEKVEYVVRNNGFTFRFTDVPERNYIANISNAWNLTAGQLKKYNISQEQYKSAKEIIQKNVEKYGTLIALYVIEIDGDTYSYEGKGTIEMNMNDDMKDYDSFKLVNIDEDTYSAKEVIELQQTNGKLVAELPHLSLYALVANKTNNLVNNRTNNLEDSQDNSDKEKTQDKSGKIGNAGKAIANPQTGDAIVKTVTILAIAVFGFLATLRFSSYYRRRNGNNYGKHI